MRLNRRAFTLVELLVATAIAGVAAAFMGATLARQQRFYSSAAAVLEVRSQLRDAADVLSADIRGAAVSTFGFPLMSDTAIEMYATIATSVACSAPAGVTVGLATATLTSGATLTSILVQPDTGDIAMLYGIPSGVADSGRWETHRVAVFQSRPLSTSCPQSAGFTSAADAAQGATAYSVTLATAPSPAVRGGAPIHFVRRARYSLYRSSDGDWYLGYRRCSASGFGCAAIQPVSGPYSAYGGGGSGGISFRYFDSAGAELSPGSSSTAVARVDLVLRGETAHASALVGDAHSAWRDSVLVTVSPRNRTR
ncbi:MAG: prepilin-type N-terminal cleavage/methylation domain-containing protein [Gemmatimonadales bacterium]